MLADEKCWFLAADFDEEFGRKTHRHSSEPVELMALPRDSSVHDPVTADMRGYSSLSRYPRASRDS
jgi:hypothetical protein